MPEPLVLHTYWVSKPFDGLCASLFVGKEEVLRIDLQPGLEHAHHNLAELRAAGTFLPRTFLSCDESADPVDMAIFEFGRNALFSIRSHRLRRVRRLDFDESVFATAAETMGCQLRELRTLHET